VVFGKTFRQAFEFHKIYFVEAAARMPPSPTNLRFYVAYRSRFTTFLRRYRAFAKAKARRKNVSGVSVGMKRSVMT
jgi:hypothetical protein